MNPCPCEMRRASLKSVLATHKWLWGRRKGWRNMIDSRQMSNCMDPHLSWIQRDLHEQVWVNINQNWPCAFEGLTPTTSFRHKHTTQSTLAFGKTRSPTTALWDSSHGKPQKCKVLPKVFFQCWAECRDQLVNVNNPDCFTTTPLWPKLWTWREFIISTQLDVKLILQRASL